MKKVLPVTYPAITSYMTHASVLSIVSTEAAHLNWFLGNYLQLSVVKNGGIDFFTPEPPLSCPYLDIQTINPELLEQYVKDPVDFLVDTIDQGYYHLPVLDTFFIKAFKARKSRPHPVFIYGYCRETKIFNIGEFFGGANFRFTTATFEEIRNSWVKHGEWDYWLTGNRLLRYKKADYKLFADRVIKQLDDYANSKNELFFLHTYNDELSFGQQAAAQRLILEVTNFIEQKRIDWVAFPLLCDHKQVVIRALKYLEQQGCLHEAASFSGKFESLALELLSLRNKFIKLVLSNNRDAANGMHEKLSAWFVHERELIQEILSETKAPGTFTA